MAETGLRYQRGKQTNNSKATQMSLLPFVSALFAAVIAAVIILWKAGASVPR
jgi:hypothetical protein